MEVLRKGRVQFRHHHGDFSSKGPSFCFYVVGMQRQETSSKNFSAGGVISLCWFDKNSSSSGPTSVTRLGDFWKFSVTWFLSKVAQMHGEFLESNICHFKLLWLLLGQLLETFGLLFNLASCHSGAYLPTSHRHQQTGQLVWLSWQSGRFQYQISAHCFCHSLEFKCTEVGTR